MERKHFVEYWEAISLSNRILLGVVVIQALCMSLMGIGFFRYVGWQKVVLLPPTLDKKVTIAGINTSKEYLRATCESIAQLLMEYTPQDIQQRIDTVLFYTEPKYEKVIKTQMEKLRLDVISTGISQLYRQEDLRLMSDGFVYMSGHIDRHIVGKPFWKSEVKLRMQFTMDKGKFSLIGIKMLLGPFDYKGKDAILKGYDEVPQKS